MKQLVALLAVAFLTSSACAQEAGGWYPFTPKNDPTAGEIGLQDWLEKPAGKHGRIVRQGESLLYNGKPARLWGLNLCFGNCVPDKARADARAAFYPKYGINAVRLHKFVESDYAAGDSAADFSPEAIDRMDYQVAKFKEAGIYTTLSVHFGAVMLGPADRKDVPWLDELGPMPAGGPRQAPRVKAAHSALFYSPELQAVHVRQIVALLKHKNPYTGLTYAEDPAIFSIECVNEQSILFYTTMGPLKQYPTLRRQVGERFSDWLKAKYGGAAGLAKAWGEKAFDGWENDGFPAGESLEKRNLLPLGNPWYWDPENLNGSQAYRKQRLLDTLEFLYTLQCECLDRYVKAVRDAGYTGEVTGSNWQAGRALSHFANLHSDWRVGLIDRHNYFGGGGGQGKPFSSGSMLARAGSGILSSGMQQAADRPFMLSEWIHCFPNEWGAEGPAIIGAYGFGLNGWDVSYMFQNGDSAGFSDRVGRDTWDVTAPQVLGVFPAVARQILRGDVQESPVVATRYVHVPSLFAGQIGFDDRVKQGYDDKELDSKTVPARALAAARCVVQFTDRPQPTPPFDIARYEKDGAVLSATGQLRWQQGRSKTDGFFTMDTPGTQAVVGFAAGQTLALKDVVLKPECRFAALYVTAQGRGQTIAGAKKLLIVAMARARNTGMKLNETEDQVLDRGKGPVLLEPVKATITLRAPRGAAGASDARLRVLLLDHDGKRTERSLPVQNGSFTIDGARDRTPYYLVEREGGA